MRYYISYIIKCSKNVGNAALNLTMAMLKKYEDKWDQSVFQVHPAGMLGHGFVNSAPKNRSYDTPETKKNGVNKNSFSVIEIYVLHIYFF